MYSFALLRVALRALRVNKGRAALTSLGIVIGIAVVTALVSAGEGARRKIDDQLNILGKNMILVRPGSYRQEGSAGALDTLTQADAEAIRREVGPLVVGVSVTQTTFRTARAANGNRWLTTFVGTSPEIRQVRGWDVAQGRFYTEDDERRGALVCLIGETVRRKLFPDRPSPVGESVQVGHLRLEVIGLLAPKGRALNGADQDDQVFLPITTLQRHLVRQEWVGVILTAARSDNLVDPVKGRVADVLRRRHHTPRGAEDFEVSSVWELVAIAYVFTSTLQALVAAIASISLVVGGVGIMNIMLVSVTERTREIGIRLAVGARPRDILTQFLTEAVLLTSGGGLLGIALGIAAAAGIARAADWPAVVSPAQVVLAWAVAAAVGIFFGFYPAWRASRLDPVVALRAD
jgi:putative ABC transport system permease protein